MKVFYLPSMALPWAAFGDRPLWSGIFLALWGRLLCCIAGAGQEEQRKGMIVAAYGPDLFVCGFPVDLAKWKGKGTLCRERAPVPILGAVTPYHGIALCQGKKRQTSRTTNPAGCGGRQGCGGGGREGVCL